jgi:NAD-dependent SIR2 family protein deacetylase
MEDKVNKYKLLVKKYLSLDNVSVLAGAGTSWHLGAPTIRNIPEKLKKTLEKDIKKYFGEEQKTSVDDNQPVEEDKPAEKKDPSFEDLLN